MDGPCEVRAERQSPGQGSAQATSSQLRPPAACNWRSSASPSGRSFLTRRQLEAFPPQSRPKKSLHPLARSLAARSASGLSAPPVDSTKLWPPTMTRPGRFLVSPRALPQQSRSRAHIQPFSLGALCSQRLLRRPPPRYPGDAAIATKNAADRPPCYSQFAPLSASRRSRGTPLRPCP